MFSSSTNNTTTTSPPPPQGPNFRPYVYNPNAHLLNNSRPTQTEDDVECCGSTWWFHCIFGEPGSIVRCKCWFYFYLAVFGVVGYCVYSLFTFGYGPSPTYVSSTSTTSSNNIGPARLLDATSSTSGQQIFHPLLGSSSRTHSFNY